MKLILDTDEEIVNPSADDIRSRIESIPPDSDEAFAILERDDTHFMQTAGNATTGFVIEYQEGGTHAHFQSTGSRLDASTVVRALVAYATGSEAWRELAAWNQVDLESLPSWSADDIDLGLDDRTA